MTDKLRGSDQLKLNCTTFSALTQEELLQVAGGSSFGFFPMIYGTPAVWRANLPSVSLPSFEVPSQKLF